MKKKVFSVFMAITVMFGVLPCMDVNVPLIDDVVSAASNYSEEMSYGDYLKYKKVDEDKNGTYDYIEISDCDESAVSIEIPTKMDGLSVTSIGKWSFSWCENLTSVELPESVTSIGDSAFNWCSKLTNITVPDSVVRIGESAFGGCAFKNITIPDNAVELSVTAFAGCDSLENIYVSGGTQNYLSEDGILFNKDKTVLFKYPAGKKYSEYIIPNNVESIISSAFAGSSNLESLIIPDGVKYIGGNAFAASKCLKKVKIPDSVTYIGNLTFNMCSNLENVTISEGITSINYGTFFNCSSLKNITIPDSVISIETYAFFGCNLINIIIPNSVTEIGSQAFSGCSFTSITIPKSVTSIYRAAFSDCINLESVKIENPDCEIYAGKETICNKYDGKNDVTYYNGIIYGYTDSTAQDYAEKNSYTFESIGEKPIVTTLPVTTTITTTITTTTTVTTTTQATTKPYNYLSYIKVDEDEDGTYDCIRILNYDKSAISVEIPTEINGLPVTKISDWVFCGCDSLKDINVSENNQSFTSEDGVLFNKDKTELIAYPAGKKDSEYVIPESVTSIDSYAFENSSNLINVTIPNSVKLIYDAAFLRCDNLTNVTISYGVSYIGDGAFFGCSSLTNITIPKSVEYICSQAFADCSNLESITIQNPQCDIHWRDAICNKFDDKVYYNGVIYGYKNSTAQFYANSNGFKFEEIQPVIKGDINNDSLVGISDVVFLQQYLVKSKNIFSEQFLAADMNSDGQVNVFDAVILKRRILYQSVF